MDPRLFSAIDASINRAMEGLRVCEDILRFSLRDAAFSSLLKDVRHRLGEEASRFPAEFLLSARDVEGEIGPHPTWQLQPPDDEAAARVASYGAANSLQRADAARLIAAVREGAS